MNRICMVIPSLHPGGMERVMSELMQDFSKRPGLELHLVLYGINREIFYPVPDSVFIHKPDFPFLNSSRLISTLKTILFLRKKIKEINPNQILSFGESWNSFVLLSLFGTSFRVYVSDRCRPDKHLGFFQETLRNFFYPNAAGIIAQTGKANQIYSRKGLNDQIVTIGNPIRSIIPGEISERQNWVLSVGRLIPTKHHDELIRLFVDLAVPDWKLVIVGGDAGRAQNLPRLRQLVKSLNAEDSVILVGNQENVDDYYRKSKIFAFTSSSEGFPNVVGEAMSAGLPVVTFDCVAGPSDMIRNGESGYLIPVFDYKLFGEKLNFLLQNESQRIKMGEKARMEIKKFSRKEICNQFYQTVCNS